MGRETKERGVTLVALIITVIILIILAAVSIKQVTDSGMADTAVEGTVDYIYEQVKERITTAINEALLDNFDAEAVRFRYETLPENTVSILRNEGYNCIEETITEEGWKLYKITGKDSSVMFHLKISTTNGSYEIIRAE